MSIYKTFRFIIAILAILLILAFIIDLVWIACTSEVDANPDSSQIATTESHSTTAENIYRSILFGVGVSLLVLGITGVLCDKEKGLGLIVTVAGVFCILSFNILKSDKKVEIPQQSIVEENTTINPTEYNNFTFDDKNSEHSTTETKAETDYAKKVEKLKILTDAGIPMEKALEILDDFAEANVD